MRRILLSVLLLVVGIAVPVSAQDDDPSFKDHPGVPRIAGYHISAYDATDFDAAEFPVGPEKVERHEGRHWKITYYINEGARRRSLLEILRNYENAFKAKGGTLVYSIPDENIVTLRMKTAAGEMWCRVIAFNNGENYELEIIEKAAMTQQVELSAAEMANALNTTGSIALHNILFDTGKATIKPESSKELGMVAEMLKGSPTLKVEIQGHTDNVGAKAANMTLSQARAAAVRDYLIRTSGIAADRLTAAGYGDTKPVGDNASEAGRAQNRRVELVKK